MAYHIILKLGRGIPERICKTLIPNLLYISIQRFECQHVKVVELNYDVQEHTSQWGLKGLTIVKCCINPSTAKYIIAPIGMIRQMPKHTHTQSSPTHNKEVLSSCHQARFLDVDLPGAKTSCNRQTKRKK